MFLVVSLEYDRVPVFSDQNEDISSLYVCTGIISLKIRTSHTCTFVRVFLQERTVVHKGQEKKLQHTLHLSLPLEREREFRPTPVVVVAF